MLLYHPLVDGIVDKFLSANSREIGECIYCGEREAALSTEHAVPYGLNGPWTLLRASCPTCSKITSRFEHDVMRRLWPDVRNVLGMQSRRRDKRSATAPLTLLRGGTEEVVQVARTKFPTYLPVPLFPKPASEWTTERVHGVFANLKLIHLCGPTLEEASKDYPEFDFIGSRVRFSPEDFARMVAKIGFCAAVAALGVGPFTNTPIRKVILGTDPCVGHWVGSWWGEPINVNAAGGGLHAVKVMCSQSRAQLHAFVRLFAQFGAREYHVMLGPADPKFVASCDWPSMWERPVVNAALPTAVLYGMNSV